LQVFFPDKFVSQVFLAVRENAYFFVWCFISLMNEVVHTSPTIGSNVEEVVWKNIHFIMWDIGGQESLRATWNTYYTNTKVIIAQCFCVCSMEAAALKALHIVLKTMMRSVGCFAVDHL
jgi:GTPase SAR1 family protein